MEAAIFPISPNVKDEEQNTPLHVACIFGHLQMVRTLLQHGANINERNISRRLLPFPIPVSSFFFFSLFRHKTMLCWLMCSSQSMCIVQAKREEGYMSLSGAVF